MDAITTLVAAAALRLSARRVRQLCKSGALPATQKGRDWLIDPADLAAFRRRKRPPGRPKKNPEKYSPRGK